MNILILNWKDLRNPDAGGAEVLVHELAAHWMDWGHEVTLFSRAFDGSASEEIVEGVPVVRRGGKFDVYREAKRWFKSHPGRFNVVFESVNTRPFMAHRFRPRVPTVALFHQTAKEIWHFEMPLPVALVGRFLLEPIWLRAYRNVPVLAYSASTKADLESHGMQDVTLVPIGAKVTRLSELPPKEDEPTFVFVGRLAENKRPDHCIEAFRLIKARLPQARLWVIGSGPMQSEMEEIAPQGTVFHGKVSEQVKFDLIARSHALLATSVREGWGLMVTEAAAVGTLPIGYDIPGLRDSIELAGGVIVPDNVTVLAEAAVRSIEDGTAVAFGPVDPPKWETTARACMEVMERVARL